MPTQQNLAVKSLLLAQTLTASANGTGVDLQGTINPGGRNMKAWVDLEAIGGTTPSYTFKMQDSPDNSVWTDIAGAAFAAITANLGAGGRQLHFVTNQRYVRMVATVTGTTPTAIVVAALVVENLIT